MTQAVLSGVAAASSEAKLIGSKLTREHLSGGSRGHFILVGLTKNNDAINWRLSLLKDLLELPPLPNLVSSSKDSIGGLLFSLLDSFALSKVAALQSFTKNSCRSIK